jgi:hypothetical protein
MENETQPPAVTKVNYPIAYLEAAEARPIVLNDISCLHIVRAIIPPRPQQLASRRAFNVATEMI